MNWLKRKIRRWLDSEQDICIEENRYSTVSPKHALSSNGRCIDSEPTLNFKVYSAVGGKIVEFSRYDPRTDKHERQMYIIGRDEDFGEKIAKISTLEVLR
jgi:hypothetical protein